MFSRLMFWMIWCILYRQQQQQWFLVTCSSNNNNDLCKHMTTMIFHNRQEQWFLAILSNNNDFFQHVIVMTSCKKSKNLQRHMFKVPTTKTFSSEFYFIFSFNMFEFNWKQSQKIGISNLIPFILQYFRYGMITWKLCGPEDFRLTTFWNK
jgi:hypothetical protein